MAKTREQKEQAVTQLTQAIDQSNLLVLCNYKGLDVVGISELRGKLREQGSSFTVAKNSLVKIALNNSKRTVEDASLFSGPVGLAFSPDEVTAAKAIFDFSKSNEAIEIIGGIDAEGKVLSSAEITALAKLPGKQELLGQVVGTVAAPLSGMVRVLNANLSGLVYALKAIQEQKTT